MSIGENIKKIRIKNEMSQVELAEKINVTQSMLCQIERGTKTVSLPLSTEIAAALDCTLDELIRD